MKKVIRTIFGKKKPTQEGSLGGVGAGGGVPTEQLQRPGCPPLQPLLLPEDHQSTATTIGTNSSRNSPMPIATGLQRDIPTSGSLSNFGGSNETGTTTSNSGARYLGDKLSVVIPENQQDHFDPRSAHEIAQLRQRILDLEKMNRQGSARSGIEKHQHQHPQKQHGSYSSSMGGAVATPTPGHQQEYHHAGSPYSMIQGLEGQLQPTSSLESSRYYHQRHSMPAEKATSSSLSNSAVVHHYHPLVNRSRVGRILSQHHKSSSVNSQPPPLSIGVPGSRRQYFRDPVVATQGILSSDSSSEESAYFSYAQGQAIYRQSAPADVGPSVAGAAGTVATVPMNRDSGSAHTHLCRSIYGSGNPYAYYNSMPKITTSVSTPVAGSSKGERQGFPQGKTEVFSRPSSPSSKEQADQGEEIESSARKNTGEIKDGNSSLPRGSKIRKSVSLYWNAKEKKLSASFGKTAAIPKVSLALGYGRTNGDSAKGKEKKTKVVNYDIQSSSTISVVRPIRTNSLSRSTSSKALSSPSKTCSPVATVRGPRPMPDIGLLNRTRRAEKPQPQLPQHRLTAMDVTYTSTGEGNDAATGDPSMSHHCKHFNRVIIESENGKTTTISTSGSASCSGDDEGDTTTVSYTQYTPGHRHHRRRHHRHHRHASPSNRSPKEATDQPRTQLQARTSLSQSQQQSLPPRSHKYKEEYMRPFSQNSLVAGRSQGGRAQTAMQEFFQDTEEYIRDRLGTVGVCPNRSAVEEQLRQEAYEHAQRMAKERREFGTQGPERCQSPALVQHQAQSCAKETTKQPSTPVPANSSSVTSWGYAAANARHSFPDVPMKTVTRVVGPIKRPTLESLGLNSEDDMSRSFPITGSLNRTSYIYPGYPPSKRNSNTFSNSNTTTSRGTARRIHYSQDLEQGVPKGRVPREGKFEIVPTTRLSNQFSTSAGSSSGGQKRLSGYELEVYPKNADAALLSIDSPEEGEAAAKVVVSRGTIVSPGNPSLELNNQHQQQKYPTPPQPGRQSSQEYRAQNNISHADLREEDASRSDQVPFSKAIIPPWDYMPSLAVYLETKMNEFLLQGEPRRMNSTKRLPRLPRNLQQRLQEQQTGNVKAINKYESISTRKTHHTECISELGTLHAPPPSLQDQPILSHRYEAAQYRNRRHHNHLQHRQRVALIKPIKVESLFKMIHRMTWEEETLKTTKQATGNPTSNSNSTSEAADALEQKSSADEEPLQMLYPVGADDTVADDAPSRSTSGLCFLAPERPTGDSDSRRPSTVTFSIPLPPPQPPVRNPVLIDGMTPEELLLQVRYEDNREGTVGYYGPREYERDQEKRRAEEIARRTTINARDREVERQEATLRGKISFPAMRALLNQEEDMEELFDDEGVDEEFEFEGKEEDDIVDSDFDQSSADEEPEEDEEANLNEDPEEAKARRKQQAMLNHLKTGKSSMSIPGGLPGNKSSSSPSSRQAAAAAVSAPKKKSTPATLRRTISSTSTSTSAAASPAASQDTSASSFRIPAEIRKSSRRTTVLNKQETELRLLEHETRRAMMPKREKVAVHKMTQEELLEEAKKTEQLNLASLQAFKAMEMEKKRVVKKKEVVMENFIRYHSFSEWVGHGPLIQDLADLGPATPAGGTRPGSRNASQPGSRAGSVAPEVVPIQYGSGQHGGGVPPQSLAQSLAQTLFQQQKPRSVTNSRDSSPNRNQPRVEFSGADGGDARGNRTPGSPMSIDGASIANQDVDMSSAVESGAQTPVQFATMNMSAGSIARKRKRLHPNQICGRNWITFMGYEDQDAPLNEWSYVENYPERKPICPITGLPAKYKDPKSGIPYANKEAYKILQNVIRHGYVWSPGLNAYCHDVAQPLPKGVPAGMAEALVGGQQVGSGIVLKDGDLISAGISGGGGGGYTYRKRQANIQE
ncbi:Vacuolar protein sorting-associated protein 72 [Gryganskiella cystojenkinii]|nr:Vacuolar protein sorting-associated protein 72 [Gryganskiella cystojenkinii]